MAQTVHLSLYIDGNKIDGESTHTTLERKDTIECSSFYYDLETPIDEGTGQITGRRLHGPVRFHKRIDKTTPLLLKALCRNEPVTEAKFRFFRTSPDGSGMEECFYTVKLGTAIISSVKQVSEDAIMAGEAAPPMMEEVSIRFRQIEWTYEINRATYQDLWR